MLKALTAIATTFRYLLAIAAAAALLFTLSYPDSLLPPDPYVADIDGVTAYTFKPVIWLLPLLLLEAICLAGAQRNRVWFTSLLTVGIGAFAAWPVLQAWRPELVHPMLDFEDVKLATGLGYFAIIAFGSVLFRLVLLAYCFRPHDEWMNSESDIDAAVLDPAKARTVREIAADTTRAQPRFLFGEADQGIIERFRLLMGKLWRRSLRRHLLLASALLALLLWFFLYPQPTEEEARERDFAAMYETDASGLRATPRAVHAAYRVMKSAAERESLAGMPFPEAEAWMKLDAVSEAYRRVLRNENAPEPASLDPVFESRTPFLTVTDGRRTAALYVRTNYEGDRITIAEVVDAGWNAVADDLRRRFGYDWRMNY